MTSASFDDPRCNNTAWSTTIAEKRSVTNEMHLPPTHAAAQPLLRLGQLAKARK